MTALGVTLFVLALGVALLVLEWFGRWVDKRRPVRWAKRRERGVMERIGNGR